MADLASTDVTYTSVRKPEIGRNSKTVIVDVAFGDGSLTYPTGGVPLDKAKLGFRDHVDSIRIVNPSHGDGFVYKPDISNLKIRIYSQGVEVEAAGSATMDDFALSAGVGVKSGITVSLNNDAGAGVHGLGALKELVASSDAPAATTLRLECVGW
jgi:hypothetical protein